MNEPIQFRITPRFIVGVAVVIAGVALLLGKLDLVDLDKIAIYWPVVLIAIGLTRLRSRTLGDVFFVAVWIGAGVWFLLDNLQLITFSPWEYGWAVLLILVGVSLVLGAIWHRQPRRRDRHASVHGFAFLSGVGRKISSPDFKAAEMAAVLGGFELDLRNAKIESGEAVIDLFALWGGVEIRVPPDWIIDSKVLPLMGSIEDNTRQETTGESPRLVIRGTVVMGGADIKN